MGSLFYDEEDKLLTCTLCGRQYSKFENTVVLFEPTLAEPDLKTLPRLYKQRWRESKYE